MEAPFCADRPGQTTPPCVLTAGEVMVEVGLASWQRSVSATRSTSDFALGSSILRVGLPGNTEVQVGWGGVVHTTHRDAVAALRERQSGVGDVTVGLAHGLSGTSGPLAIQAFVTLPTGTGNATAGAWAGGVRIPANVDLPEGWQLGLTPEFDLVGNGSGTGHHLALGGAAGLSHAIATNVSAGVDISVFEDRDPADATTTAITTASLAWQPGRDTQLDIGAGVGVTRNAPDVLLYLGIVQRL